MKHSIFLFLLVTGLGISCPTFAQSLTIGAGRSAIPGDFYMLRYEAASNSPLNWSLGLHAQRSHKNGLDYSSIGIDGLLIYPLNNSEYAEGIFSFRPGLGITANMDTEPWVYAARPLAGKLNYGFVAEAAGEWCISDDFCCMAFVQQKYLFNSSLGNTAFHFGIALRFRFSH